jgi:Spy/CpxP family protein refolding chaperone
VSGAGRDDLPPARSGGGRLIAALVLVVVAFVGVAAGVALDRKVLVHRPQRFDCGGARRPGGSSAATGTRGGGRRMRDCLADTLALSSAQRQRFDSLMERQLAEFRTVREKVQPQMDSIVDATRRAVDSLLTPEQRQKLEQMRRTRAFGPPFPGMERRRDPGAPPPP